MSGSVLRTACLVLATLAMGGGLLGMAASFFFLASGSQPDNIAGAAGFVAGSVLLGCGLLSLTMLAVREESATAEPLARRYDSTALVDRTHER